ncbi:Uncharacterized protein TCM_006884 [Theobroma cacao]|uniref:Uncharacterized protein n=1 Tax=Theobroma cacao TaxID=3641 RepID=A0A061E6V1_THECC|nr:Uncharacterized protein TCM_006884 [Theobroma cacao]
MESLIIHISFCMGSCPANTSHLSQLIQATDVLSTLSVTLYCFTLHGTQTTALVILNRKGCINHIHTINRHFPSAYSLLYPYSYRAMAFLFLEELSLFIFQEIN